MNDLSSEIGLIKRQVRDVQSVAGNVQHLVRRLVDGRGLASDRPGSLVARAAACSVVAYIRRRGVDDVADEFFGSDRDLERLLEFRAATPPAMTTVATWAAELVETVVQDVAARLLPESVFVRLRRLGLEYAFAGGGLIKAPTWSPVATGGFVGEGAPIPVSKFTFQSLGLTPRKAANIVAVTDELFLVSAVEVEVTLRTILAESLGLMVDSLLLDANAGSAIRPPGLLNGVTPLTATAGGGLNALLGDVKQLTAAIAPALKPVLITGPVQAASLGLLAPASTLMVLTSPTVAAGTVIAVDAAAFASAMGVPTFKTSIHAALHEDTVPLPLSTVGSPNVVSAPMRSTFQTDATALRSILPCDWTLRRTGAVSFLTGATW